MCARTHLPCMSHLTFDPHTFAHDHRGLVHFGEASLFTVVVFAIAGLLVVFGAYMLAENALQGLADLARAAAP